MCCLEFWRGLCCCCGGDSTAEEREPLIVPPESARQPRPPRPNGSEQKHGEVRAQHVGVPDLDQRFADVAEMFNEQQKHYETMEDKRNLLLHRYRCSPGDGLSECLKKIKDEHDTHLLRLQIKGYDFSLAVTPEDAVPDKLMRTQESIIELCQAAKAIVATGTRLQEMINSLLREEETLTQQVKAAATSHQEQRRLEGNLLNNIQEARRAKELSYHYRNEAGKLLNEAALLSGVNP
ncbi:uncharacterized protein [Salminus brasiliensis]|uniref:uncharacterized protein n=1 Tax=Salminus brasiliensis TaxID=930266 RepID=UPI003B83222C